MRISESGSSGHLLPRPTVVGVDEGKGCETALDWAAREAAATGGRLRLVSVVPGDGLRGWDLAEYQMALAEHRVEFLTGSVHRRFPGVPVDSLVATSGLREVLRVASEEARLVVLGASSQRRGWRSPVEEAHLGSTTRYLVGHAGCPVVVVPADSPPGAHEVVAGDDGSAAAAAAVDFAAAQAAGSGCDLVLVRAFRSEVPASVYVDSRRYRQARDEEEADLTRALDEARRRTVRSHPRLQVRTLLAEGEPEDALCRRALPTCLLVVGRHGRGFTGVGFPGSTTSAVLRAARTPVAVVPRVT